MSVEGKTRVGPYNWGYSIVDPSVDSRTQTRKSKEIKERKVVGAIIRWGGIARWLQQ